jgi:hypothetical protein
MDTLHYAARWGAPGAATPHEQLARTVARWKVRQSMTWLEDALRSLSRAAEQLAAVRGAGREHGRLVGIYERVHREWSRLEALLGRVLDLDREPLPAELDAIRVREGT